MVSSNPQVIYMRETCGQRSSMAAGSTLSAGILFVHTKLLMVQGGEGLYRECLRLLGSFKI